MKTNFFIPAMIFSIILLMLSCTKDFEKINTDPNNVLSVAPQQLLAPALRASLNYNMIRNRNFNNELMQVTVDMSDGDSRVFRYDYRSTWSDYLWNGIYIELTNFKDMYHIAKGDSTQPQTSYMGISLILQSWLYSILTDTYGDVPFLQANSARKEYGDVKEPAFDSQKDIYLGLFHNLEQANQLLKAGQPVDTKSDPIYHGDVAKWRRFGNSLYLRLLLRVSAKAELASAITGKIKEIVETSSSEYPVFTNNNESAILKWTGTGAYISPYVNGVRAQDFRSPGIAEFFIDNLKYWNDPRLDGDNYGIDGISRWGIAKSGGEYAGTESGYPVGADITRGSYFYATDQAAAITMQSEPLSGMMMNYAELQFILAEAAVKGWISGQAESYYKEGVKNSITLWLPEWNVDIDTYLATPASSGKQWTETASVNDKMEKIHVQKYYALFFADLQQWFEHRRTGHPVLPKGSGLENNGVMPARMVYPVYVQSTNPTNYKRAVQQQGPDQIYTQVWWQKP
ncbi:SusD/RagB family nutrient-binding outer membrane lipoprotein [Niabella yanshanensis]|uniref:SusD/RagB family nutrient-binding outer membrane lipoprotein n=1 Tax=Niabella yanshanensis TaxID=577386 RepID=A0ABZ0W4A2_9BACT|nr:SusD/RagB family nutrient-binding outer membrane lipoprotein [Niabella yanshanensis]WQD36911.1 SusD/RagB family nutrient-binding outer membrane lipoprotein [Niabella yanshanensis]